MRAESLLKAGRRGKYKWFVLCMRYGRDVWSIRARFWTMAWKRGERE